MITRKLIWLCIAISLLSCTNRTTTVSVNSAADSLNESIGKEQSAAIATTIPDGSVFNVSGQWKTENETSFQFSQLSGMVTVTAMIFTSCQSACPRIMVDLKKIESALTADELKHVKFVLISMDPENDTPERLKAFSTEYQLKDNWTLVCSDEDATMEMANVLGVRIKKLSGGGFDHSNSIYVLSPDGLISHQQDGLGMDPAETIKTIRSFHE